MEIGFELLTYCTNKGQTVSTFLDSKLYLVGKLIIMNYDVTDCYNVTRIMNEQKSNLQKRNHLTLHSTQRGCNLFDLIRVENGFLSSSVQTLQTFGDTFS